MTERRHNGALNRPGQNLPQPQIYQCKGWCGFMTRASTHTEERFPGTRSRVRNGMCSECARRAEQEAIEAGMVPAPEPKQDDEAKLRDWKHSLAGYMRRRQEREEQSIQMVLRSRRGKLSA